MFNPFHTSDVKERADFLNVSTALFLWVDIRICLHAPEGTSEKHVFIHVVEYVLLNKKLIRRDMSGDV